MKFIHLILLLGLLNSSALIAQPHHCTDQPNNKPCHDIDFRPAKK
ncbi:hypothetical protein [Candidatus Albibeggiatoa sp. nov. NOAA]|nr:hypothetical protein [Thiotrichaceae bacterium]